MDEKKYTKIGILVTIVIVAIILGNRRINLFKG